jgi:BON domain
MAMRLYTTLQETAMNQRYSPHNQRGTRDQDHRGGGGEGHERDDWREPRRDWQSQAGPEAGGYGYPESSGRGYQGSQSGESEWGTEGTGGGGPRYWEQGRSRGEGGWRGEQRGGEQRGYGQGATWGPPGYGQGASGYGSAGSRPRGEGFEQSGRGGRGGGYGDYPEGTGFGEGRERGAYGGGYQSQGSGGWPSGSADETRGGWGRNRGQRRFNKGPKGYSRSDERIKEDVSECLMREEGVDPSEVTVEVSSGIVVLEGSVPERHMKYIIEDIVDGCMGVKDVRNQLRVSRSGEGSETGASQSALSGSQSAQSGTDKGRKGTIS